MNIIDEVAKQIYEDAHAGMSNVWGWNDEGLDHEHPDTRQRFMGYARSALSVLPTNSDDRILALLDELDSRQAGCEIADAVIAWMVNRDFADPGTEVHAAQVLEMLDSLVRDDSLRAPVAVSEVEPVCHLVWQQGRVAVDDYVDYYEVARPGDKSVDGSDSFPVFTAPPGEDGIAQIAMHLDCEPDTDSILHTIREIQSDLEIAKDCARAALGGPNAER